MCVLTYLPTKNNGFIFTSNRDEKMNRVSAIPPRKYEVEGRYMFYPKDPQGNGTWIGGCDTFTLCLLNGGLNPHISSPPYRQSRGKVILDFYRFQNEEKFINNYQFDGIEPFTLVIINRQNEKIYYEIRWTGKEVLSTVHARAEPRIWSSVTLYSPQIIREREQWFNDFLQNKPDYTAEDILWFHHSGGKGDIRNDIKMNRDEVLKTLSITQFQVDTEEFLVNYEDLQKNKKYVYRVFIECV
ncbi:NRDE family protein [Emticicia sp. BO119]|uniref:NRDE family protein n=1 Tax=Emticicia sp. BO119 TaxID=2757768 RepID=UPI0015F0AC62|nr:NRDE family protein [Emticicia sp. BO119]MBA4849259.1 NRDE family protein [Emticicia sp. BO119]